jgi:hypothetical protein
MVERRLYIQPNSQFFSIDREGSLQQNHIYFQEDDRVHLSTRGKMAFCCCFRDGLHQILREYEFLD